MTNDELGYSSFSPVNVKKYDLIHFYYHTFWEYTSVDFRRWTTPPLPFFWVRSAVHGIRAFPNLIWLTSIDSLRVLATTMPTTRVVLLERPRTVQYPSWTWNADAAVGPFYCTRFENTRYSLRRKLPTNRLTPPFTYDNPSRASDLSATGRLNLDIGSSCRPLFEWSIAYEHMLAC